MEATLGRKERLERSKQSLGLRTIWFLLKCATVMMLTVITAHYITLAWGIGIERAQGIYDSFIQAITRTKIVTEYVKPQEVPLEVLVSTIAHEQRVPVVALQAIVDQESSGGTKLYRFEPKVYERIRGGRSDDESRMLASSHGPAHVMGFNAKLCGITWDKLYEPYTGITCGAKILKANLEKYKSERDIAMRLQFAFRDYNGSGDDARQYATEVMARVGQLLFKEVREEM